MGFSFDSSPRLHWQSIDFGSRCARFHTSGVSRLYLRVFPSNLDHHGIDLSFGIPSYLEHKVSDAFRCDLEQNAIFLA